MRFDKRCAAALALAVVIASATGAVAQELETRGEYCNDSYFASDGSGISGCFNFAARYGVDTVGIGLVGATPELRSNLKGTDPLKEIGRLTGWYSREFESDALHYAVTGRIGIEGGAADELALGLKEALHNLFGFGNKNLKSQKATTFIGGVSGWVRDDWIVSNSSYMNVVLSPYGHAALGNDTIEGGAGLMLAFQSTDENQALALVMPKNGAYAPTFGGDGFGVFAGMRGVALETLYGDLANAFIAEVGITGQVTYWDFAVIGVSTSCTTFAYDGVDRPDCKAVVNVGGLF